MTYYYELIINYRPDLDPKLISEILGIQPADAHVITDGRMPVRLNWGCTPAGGSWELQVTQADGDEYFDFVAEFLDLVESHQEELKQIGIETSDISLWLLYEYDQQCNMEFDPEQLARLGKSGVRLCISCWQDGFMYL